MIGNINDNSIGDEKVYLNSNDINPLSKEFMFNGMTIAEQVNYDNMSQNLCPWMKPQCTETFILNSSSTQDKIKEKITLDLDERINFNKNSINSCIRLRTTDVKPNYNSSFSKFNLDSGILLALKEKKWDWPSPIQQETISKIIEGKNVIARSKNGTGKTGAYTIGILNKINFKKQSQVIILVPTRELALQTANVCFSISKYLTDIKVMVTTGGTRLVEDIFRLMKHVNVIVGTPNRLLDLLSISDCIFSDITCLVIDEADMLISSDSKPIVEKIINKLPKHCQKVLFSATYPVSLKSFVETYLINFDYCNVMNELTLKGVTQYYAYLKENQKVSCLKVLIGKLDVHQAIIFCNSSQRVELLAKYITDAGYSTYYIHAKMNQSTRNRVFHDFRSGFVTFLVCTDIMSRGIDIATVNVVFNFDFPLFNDIFLHRIGRCGRFGHLGIAINLITAKDKDRFQTFEKELDTAIYAIPRHIDKRLYVSQYQMGDEFENFDK